MRLGLIFCHVIYCIDFVYHHYEEGTKLLQSLADTYPHLCQLYSIGTSVQNRKLWVLQITENVKNRTPGRPRVKIVSNMHGDETVGRELTFQLAQFIVENYESDPIAKYLVKNIDLHLMPSLNPDGFEKAIEGRCEGPGRNNANGVDLNRNFPDQYREPNWIHDRKTSGNRKLEVETVAMTNWIQESHFVISLNLHAGSEVASYPYDDGPSNRGYSAAPDDGFFKHLARVYADNHATMKTQDQRACNHAEPSFHNGITNGADWYPVAGGMEDFNYLHGDCYEITIELTCCKYPKQNELENEWKRNKDAIIEYIKTAYQGLHGFVFDHRGRPLEDAAIDIAEIGKTVHTDVNGDYWRPLLKGTYQVTASMLGYISDFVEITMDSDTVFHNFTLKPEAPTAEDPEMALIHRNHEEMTKFLHEMEERYPTLCKVDTIGKSVQGRDLWIVEISDNPGEHEVLEPEFKLIGNMHGNEAKGRVIAIALIQHLLDNYENDERITQLVDNHRIIIMPSMNPDGHEKAFNAISGKTKDEKGAKLDSYGRDNSNGIDLNRNFPDQFETPEFPTASVETQLMIDWMESNYFVLSLNMHSGALVANYPYDNSPLNGRRKRAPASVSDDDDIFKYLAGVYAKNHPTMSDGESCKSDKVGLKEYPDIGTRYGVESFPNGIVNGRQWYSVAGGMQDWNYVHTNCMELTIETGCVKYPAQQYLPEYWEDNKLPILEYIEQSHMGIIGIVSDAEDNPIQDACIEIKDTFATRPRDHIVRTTQLGDFFRPLLPGQYKATIFKDGYWNETHYFILTEDFRSLEMNFNLEKFVKGEAKPVSKSGYFHQGMTEDHMENQINSIIYGEYGDYGHDPKEFEQKQKAEKEMEEREKNLEIDVIKDDLIATEEPKVESTIETTTEEPTTEKPTTTTEETTTTVKQTEKAIELKLPEQDSEELSGAPEKPPEVDDEWDFEDESQGGSWLLRFVAVTCICALVFCFYLYVRKRQSISGSGAFFIPPKMSLEMPPVKRRLLQNDSDEEYVKP